MAKVKHYKSLMEAIGGTMANMQISTKSQSPFGPSAYYNAQFPAQASGAHLTAVSSYNNNLLQMAGFLAGTILMDIRGVGKPDSVKWELNAYLKSQFNVTTFNIGDNIQNKIYII